MNAPFETIKIPTDQPLLDYEVEIRGRKLIVLTTPAKAVAKINSRYAEPIPLINIEQLQMEIDRIYITSPADLTPVQLLVVKDDDVQVDANSQYSVIAMTASFLAYSILTSAKRGNYSEVIELTPDAIHVVSKPYIVAGQLIENIISFTLLSPASGWSVEINSIHPATGEILKSELDLSSYSEFDVIHQVAFQLIFKPVSATSNLKVLVDYLYLPVWRG